MALFGKRKRGGYNPLATDSMAAEAPQMPTGGAMATYGAMTPGQGMSAPQAAPIASQAAPSVDWGNIARNVLGNVGDAVSTYYGGPRVFAEQEAIQRQGAMLAQQQRHSAMLKAQELAAQAAKPTARQKEISDFLALPPEEQATYSKALNEITPGSNEPLVINTAYGDIMGTRSQIMQVLRELSASAGGEAPSQAGGSGGKIPPDAIRELIQNPETANFFDEAFGPGMAAQYLGQ